MYIGSLQPKGRRLVSGGTVQYWSPGGAPPPSPAPSLGALFDNFRDPIAVLGSRLNLPTAGTGSGIRPLGASAAPATTAIAAASSAKPGGLLGGLGRAVGGIFNLGKGAVDSAGSFSAGYRDVTGQAPPAVPAGLLDKARLEVEKLLKKKREERPAIAPFPTEATYADGGPNWLLLGGGALAVTAVGVMLLRGGKR